jgi:hypothetical protein
MNERDDAKYKNYLGDLGNLIKERALEAKKISEKEVPGSDGFYFESGRLLGFNEVISIMQQQARGFQIPLEELDLHDIEPDRDLA